MDSETQQRALILIRPSYLSGNISTFLSAYLVIFTLWSSIGDSALAKQGVVFFAGETSEIISASGVMSIFYDILNDSAFNQLFYLLAWAFAGFLAYVGFLIAIKGLGPVKDIIDIHSQVNVNQRSALFEIATKIAFRVFLAIVIIIYFIFLMQLIVPVGIGIVELASSLRSINDILSIVVSFMFLFVSFQLLTVLIRLFAMKLRVFGGSYLMR